MVMSVSRIRVKGRLKAKARNRMLLAVFFFGLVIGWFLAVTFTSYLASASSVNVRATVSAVAPTSFSPPFTPIRGTLVGHERHKTSLWTITAYCPCRKCCGKWAENRPNGKVFGAYGIELQEGISCAAPLPYGTVIDIEGVGEYTVMDTTADWIVERYNGKIVDIYFTNHEQAVQFGKRTAKIRILR